MAKDIEVPRTALDSRGNDALSALTQYSEIPQTTFSDPDPFTEFTFPDRFSAKRAIAAELGTPLAKLSQEQLWITSTSIA